MKAKPWHPVRNAAKVGFHGVTPTVQTISDPPTQAQVQVFSRATSREGKL